MSPRCIEELQWSVMIMAYFDYFCDKCKKTFEIQASINDDRSWVKCTECGSGKVRRVFDTIVVPKKSSGGGKRSPAASSGSSCSTCHSHNCATCG